MEELAATTTSVVSLWYQRVEGPDFIIKIRNEDDGYKIQVVDDDERDPVHNNFVFTEVAHLVEYLRILHRVILTDHDTDQFYTHFQYAIPFFPSIIVPISYVRTHPNHYDTFIEALEFFFRH